MFSVINSAIAIAAANNADFAMASSACSCMNSNNGITGGVKPDIIDPSNIANNQPGGRALT